MQFTLHWAGLEHFTDNHIIKHLLQCKQWIVVCVKVHVPKAVASGFRLLIWTISQHWDIMDRKSNFLFKNKILFVEPETKGCYVAQYKAATLHWPNQ